MSNQIDLINSSFEGVLDIISIMKEEKVKIAQSMGFNNPSSLYSVSLQV